MPADRSVKSTTTRDGTTKSSDEESRSLGAQLKIDYEESLAEQEKEKAEDEKELAKLERRAAKDWTTSLKPWVVDDAFGFPINTVCIYKSDAKKVYGLTEKDLSTLPHEAINATKRLFSKVAVIALAEQKSIEVHAMPFNHIAVPGVAFMEKTSNAHTGNRRKNNFTDCALPTPAKGSSQAEILAWARNLNARGDKSSAAASRRMRRY